MPDEAASRESLGQIFPELVDLFETDREAEQALGDPVALPAVTALHGRVDTAEARRVRDHPGSRLDGPRIRDVEGDQPRVAGVADELDLRMLFEASGELGRGRRDP